MDLKDSFRKFIYADTYQRVDDTHPLDLYIGIDGAYRWTLLLVCDDRPQNLKGSKVIVTKIGERKDGRWSVSLSLINADFQEIFVLMCNDIIEASRLISDKRKGAKFVADRYIEWKEMFAGTGSELLSNEKIKGLLGEMYFLDKELLDRYGCNKAVLSWTGPKAFHQDFIVDDTWYEIKTVSSGKTDIQISSVEQLDSEFSGTLIVIFADKTSKTNKNSITLNKIYSKLLEEIDDDDVKADFSNMLLKYGYYPRPEYDADDFTFEIKNVWHYKVDRDFPCLRRTGLPTEVTKVTYMISLPAVRNFREES